MAAAEAPNLDMSLEDMIAANNSKTRRREGGRRGNNNGRNLTNGTIVLGGGSGGGGAARSSGRTARRGMPYAVPFGQAASPDGSKIMVSNLHFNVTEADLKELFSTQIGPLRKVILSYDQSGRSRGIAEVVFRNEKDAAVAYQRFNGVTLDGRPMKIEIILQPSQLRRNLVVGLPNESNGANRRVSGGGRGRGRSRRGGRRGGSSRPEKSAEELDAEMAAYMSGTADKSVVMDGDTPM